MSASAAIALNTSVTGRGASAAQAGAAIVVRASLLSRRVAARASYVGAAAVTSYTGSAG